MEVLGLEVWPIVAGLVGALALLAFYSVLASNWPENYYQSTDRLSFTVSRKFSRYIAFRFLPLIVVTTMVVGVSRSHAESGRQAAVSILVFHLALHVVRSLVASIRRKGDFVPLAPSRIWVLSFITLGAFASVGTGYTLVVVFRAPTPSLRETAVAALAAGLATFFIAAAKLLTIDDSTSESLLEVSKRTISPGLEDEIREIALENDVDPDLFVAIMYAENLQRPKWVRRLENAKVMVFHTGTTGLFQQPSRHRVSDVESARAAATKLSGTWPRSAEWLRADWSVKEAAERQNPDRAFADQVAAFYEDVAVEPIALASGLARDGRPLISLRRLTRFRGEATLRGEKSNDCGPYVARITMADGTAQVREVREVNDESNRTAWGATIPFDFEQVLLVPKKCRNRHLHNLKYPT